MINCLFHFTNLGCSLDIAIPHGDVLMVFSDLQCKLFCTCGVLLICDVKLIKLIRGLVWCANIGDAASINVEGDFDLRSTARGRRHTIQVECATALTLEILYAQVWPA